MQDDKKKFLFLAQDNTNQLHYYKGGERQSVVEQMANMMGLKAIRLKQPLGQNACSTANGGCSHLCFNRPNDYVCSCPLGELNTIKSLILNYNQ